MEKVSNETIYALLEEFKNDTTKHLAKLNGQVSDNTQFRLKALGGMIVIGFLGIGGIVTSFVAIFMSLYR